MGNKKWPCGCVERKGDILLCPEASKLFISTGPKQKDKKGLKRFFAHFDVQTIKPKPIVAV